MTSVLLIGLLLGLAIGIPISLVMGVASLAAFIVEGTLPLQVLPQRLFAGINSFPIMAIPFFILAADLMGGGSLIDSLIRFSNDLVGHIRGGLGHVNVLVSMFFAGISGSALADAAGPSAIVMNMMRSAGYEPTIRELTAATAVIAPIIPQHHHGHVCPERRSSHCDWVVPCGGGTGSSPWFRADGGKPHRFNPS